MILSKTPLRMSFVGGGSDLLAYYKDRSGAVLSTAIDKYIYIALNRKFDGRIRLSYSRTEEVDHSDGVEHPLFREALAITGVESGVEIASLADIPSKGSGLGSSSSFTVGLLNALYAHQGKPVSKHMLAEQACEIEIGRCREPIGKQDQYAAAFGGLNLIQFNPDESVSVDPVLCSAHTLRAFEDHILIFFTGRTRSASQVLARQSEALNKREHKLLMDRMVELAFELKLALESDELEAVGMLLHENWKLKIQMADGITDSQIDGWYEAGIANGATGGKLLGAGNGGFIMFYAAPQHHLAIKTALSTLKPITLGFDRSGAQISYYNPERS